MTHTRLLKDTKRGSISLVRHVVVDSGAETCVFRLGQRGVYPRECEMRRVRSESAKLPVVDVSVVVIPRIGTVGAVISCEIWITRNSVC